MDGPRRNEAATIGSLERRSDGMALVASREAIEIGEPDFDERAH
jgi:hypothetical protein